MIPFKAQTLPFIGNDKNFESQHKVLSKKGSIIKHIH